MARNKNPGEWDRINLRIETPVKTAIEKRFGTSAIPEDSHVAYFSRLARADLERLGVTISNGAPAANVPGPIKRTGKMGSLQVHPKPSKVKPAKPKGPTKPKGKPAAQKSVARRVKPKAAAKSKPKAKAKAAKRK